MARAVVLCRHIVMIDPSEQLMFPARLRSYTIKNLLSRKANPNYRNSEGRTPLEQAIEYGAPEVVTGLLNANASTEQFTSKHMTPLEMAIARDNGRWLQPF